MTPTRESVRRGVSKAQWVEAALEALTHGNVSEISIGNLAKALGTSRSGFYWHFKDRDELLQELLDFWTHEITETITGNPELLRLDPMTRMIKAMEIVTNYDFSRHEIAIRQWAMNNESAAAAVEGATQKRVDYFRNALSELGLDDNEVEMRATTAVCYYTWEPITYPNLSLEERRAMIKPRLKMIASGG